MQKAKDKKIGTAPNDKTVVPGKASATNFNKCSDTQCTAAGEGDCDKDDECQGDLKCGVNNCGGDMDPLADCCYDPKDTTAAACDGQGTNMWTCCGEGTTASPAKKCKANEGDCDSDDECESPLVCGRNSCSFTIPSANKDRFFPAGQADCCISKSRSLFYGIPTPEDLREDSFRNAEEPGFLNV